MNMLIRHYAFTYTLYTTYSTQFNNILQNIQSFFARAGLRSSELNSHTTPVLKSLHY